MVHRLGHNALLQGSMGQMARAATPGTFMRPPTMGPQTANGLSEATTNSMHTFMGSAQPDRHGLPVGLSPGHTGMHMEMHNMRQGQKPTGAAVAGTPKPPQAPKPMAQQKHVNPMYEEKNPTAVQREQLEAARPSYQKGMRVLMAIHKAKTQGKPNAKQSSPRNY
jgi:hypothetical protein